MSPAWGITAPARPVSARPGISSPRPMSRPCIPTAWQGNAGRYWRPLSGGDILELGAGSGMMAQDLLLELEALDGLPERYLILETGADLRRRQQELFSSRIPHLLPRITWLETLPKQPLSGVIIASEVVDALPVSRVALNKGELHELCVGHDGDDFFWIEAPWWGQSVNHCLGTDRR